MPTKQTSTEMAASFSGLPWHDSELIGWTVEKGSADQAVATLHVNFMSKVAGGPAEIRFEECRGVYSDVDLLAKSLCGDQIATGYCEDAGLSEAVFVKRLNDRFDLYRGASTEGLFVFGVKLIHPGGELLVIARSFSLVPYDRPQVQSAHVKGPPRNR